MDTDLMFTVVVLAGLSYIACMFASSSVGQTIAKWWHPAQRLQRERKQYRYRQSNVPARSSNNRSLERRLGRNYAPFDEDSDVGECVVRNAALPSKGQPVAREEARALERTSLDAAIVLAANAAPVPPAQDHDRMQGTATSNTHPAPLAETISVDVLTVGGNLRGSFQVSFCEKVATLIARMSLADGCIGRLALGGNLLAPTSTLADAGVTNGSQVTLIVENRVCTDLVGSWVYTNVAFAIGGYYEQKEKYTLGADGAVFFESEESYSDGDGSTETNSARGTGTWCLDEHDVIHIVGIAWRTCATSYFVTPEAREDHHRQISRADFQAKYKNVA